MLQGTLSHTVLPVEEFDARPIQAFERIANGKPVVAVRNGAAVAVVMTHSDYSALYDKASRLEAFARN